ncbi:hypothetical protein Ait01nite_034980 [Actinoplanes italicus]|uniref:SPW repeat-containing protein n=1 Tax=Actinoplanes italicus TaxID=113567 RepID=A0A2T0K9F7_9ACTN|nr:hypothetical protein [Actinoplanes italicus]PRX19533.1 hypothetical protein CLV67_110285 [Actinoplanes italicus]GIE30453.1 hypothetical protein Ait01nite_034980 [Actinoplanes italicus]
MRTRALLVAAGVLLMGYAVAGALADPDLSPGGVLIFLAGVLVGHDAVWMAVLSAAGATISRYVPEERRPAVRTAAISAAAISFVALPLTPGLGRSAGDLALVLVLIAGAALLTFVPRRKDSERPRCSRSGGRGR